MGKKHRVLVYGTLRQNRTEQVNEQVTVRGRLFNVGSFPALRFNDIAENTYDITCEVREVDDDGLKSFDAYEGYREGDDKGSLYRRVWVEKLDAWIYEYNQSFTGLPEITSGDWFNKEAVSV